MCFFVGKIIWRTDQGDMSYLHDVLQLLMMSSKAIRTDETKKRRMEPTPNTKPRLEYNGRKGLIWEDREEQNRGIIIEVGEWSKRNDERGLAKNKIENLSLKQGNEEKKSGGREIRRKQNRGIIIEAGKWCKRVDEGISVETR